MLFFSISYIGPIRELESLKKAVNGGPKSPEYTELVHFIASETRELLNMDECVNATKSPEDSSSFLLELSSFLKELMCPFTCLTQGHMSDRLSTDYDKLLLLDYLIKELFAARMFNINKPEQKLKLKIVSKYLM